MCEDSLCSHLQRVGLGEVCEPAHSHGDPDVHHLGGDVAQRKVADHHFLRHGGVCQTGVMDGRERRPHNLGGRGRGNAITHKMGQNRRGYFSFPTMIGG